MAKYCGNCGAELSNDKYCSSCGLSIDEEIEVPTEAKNDFTTENEEEPTSELQQMPEIKEIAKEEAKEPKLEGIKPVIRKKPISLVVKILIVFLIIFILGIVFALFSINQPQSDNTIPTKIGNINAVRVGTPEYGYLSLPQTWTKFSTEEQGKTIQYSDGTGWIVTLYAVSNEQLTPKTWTDTLIEEMKKMNAEDIKYEKTTIYKYDGYTISGYYKELNVYLTAWLIDGKDNKTHYISLEGPGKLTKDNSYYEIIKSFRINK